MRALICFIAVSMAGCAVAQQSFSTVRFLDSAGTNYSAHKAPSSLGANQTITDYAVGTAGCVKDDGAGNQSVSGCASGLTPPITLSSNTSAGTATLTLNQSGSDNALNTSGNAFIGGLVTGASFSMDGAAGTFTVNGIGAPSPIIDHNGNVNAKALTTTGNLTVNGSYGITSGGALTVTSCSGCGGGGGVTSATGSGNISVSPSTGAVAVSITANPTFSAVALSSINAGFGTFMDSSGNVFLNSIKVSGISTSGSGGHKVCVDSSTGLLFYIAEPNLCP
jgi:hypothetical protein